MTALRLKLEVTERADSRKSDSESDSSSKSSASGLQDSWWEGDEPGSGGSETSTPRSSPRQCVAHAVNWTSEPLLSKSVLHAVGGVVAGE
eukprot:1153227-Amphidinium_carterae.1